MLAVGEFVAGGGYVGFFIFDGTRIVVDMFFAELNFEVLEFDFFGEEVELAVVAHVVELFFVTGNQGFAIGNFGLFAAQRIFEFGDFVAIVGDTGVETGDVVLKVFDFEGEFAAYGFDAVDFAEDGLKLVERFQTLFHRKDLFVFLIVSHIVYV